MWGNRKHFEYINQEIKKAKFELEPGEEIVVYKAHGNEGESVWA